MKLCLLFFFHFFGPLHLFKYPSMFYCSDKSENRYSWDFQWHNHTRITGLYFDTEKYGNIDQDVDQSSNLSFSTYLWSACDICPCSASVSSVFLERTVFKGTCQYIPSQFTQRPCVLIVRIKMPSSFPLSTNTKRVNVQYS